MSENHETNAQDIDASLTIQPRRITAQQMFQFEAYAAEILAALGMKLNDPATKDTPHRFIQALYDAT